jgi:hypothetical protein
LYHWEADGIADHQLASLPQGARRQLADFMDAVIIVDPMEYQRSPSEPRKPLRTLHFGLHNEGLVTFLVYPPEDLVLVTRIQWLGE